MFYGLNVAVLVLAVMAIVLFVNYVAYRHVFWRGDFTAGGQYSLGQQTRSILGNLDQDIRLVVLANLGPMPSQSEAEMHLRIVDLLDEYDRRSPKITVEHIDPGTDLPAYEAFQDDLLLRYEAQLKPLGEALDKAEPTFDGLSAFAARQADRIQGAWPNLLKLDAETLTSLRVLYQSFKRLEGNVDQVKQVLKIARQDTPPNETGAKLAIEDWLKGMRDELLKPAVEQFRIAAAKDDTPADAREFLTNTIAACQPVLDQLNDQISKLETVSADAYDQIRSRIAAEHKCVVLMANDSARALTFDELYPNRRQIQIARASGQPAPEQRFVGEQAITGAILSVTMPTQPKVVFINPNPVPALMPNRQAAQMTHSQVAERLRSMNFQVDEWSPTPRRGPMGRMMPPGPKPTAEEGQTLIYIMLPSLMPPQQQQMGMNPAEQQIGQALQEHLAAGRPALVMLNSSPMAFGGAPNPLADQLKPFGIEADMGRVIFSPIVDQTGRARGAEQVMIKDWPDDTAMGKACAGLEGVLIRAVSLKLTDKPDEDLETWPLIETDDTTWSAMSFGPSDNVQRAEDDPGGLVAVGAAAQRAQQRLVVISSPVWASDMITEAGPQTMFGEMLYARFPANAEMFTNSVYWLASGPFESLIATSAYTQDVARIGEMSRPAYLAAWWLLLILPPALTLGAGAVVWLFRRR